MFFKRHFLLTAILACFINNHVQAQSDKAEELIDRYVGTWDIDDFLAEKDIKNELDMLVGNQINKLTLNFSVSGAIEYQGGGLVISGNAPHRGTEEEAIVCVQAFGADIKVHASIYSNEEILIYTRENDYRFLPTCVKDWVTLVNSKHVYRSKKPNNVLVIRPDNDVR